MRLLRTPHRVDVLHNLNGICLGLLQRLYQLLCRSLLSVLSLHFVHNVGGEEEGGEAVFRVGVFLVEVPVRLFEVVDRFM